LSGRPLVASLSDNRGDKWAGCDEARNLGPMKLG
jgi:hypothetical protein